MSDYSSNALESCIASYKVADLDFLSAEAECKDSVGTRYLIELNQIRSYSVFSDGCLASPLRSAGLILPDGESHCGAAWWLAATLLER